MLTIIAAITRDGGLGKDGDMLYHISADLRRFKALTMGHPIIMGRKTFESFPGGPLPGRRNLVISRNPAYSHPGIETYPSLEEALRAAGEDAYIIGGGEIYTQAMPLADRLEITEIDALSPDADTFFPAIDPERWRICEERGPFIDPRSGASYRFISFQSNC